MQRALRRLGIGKSSSDVRKSNVEVLAIAKARKYSPKKKKSRDSSKRLSVTESVVYAAKQVKSQLIKKKMDDVDLDANDKAMQNAVAVAKHALDSLKAYKQRLHRIMDDSNGSTMTGGQRLREMAKNNSLICDVIGDLGGITEHLRIALRIELLKVVVAQEIHDSKHQYLLRKTQIECTNNNHLMTDVLKDYLKKSNANKKRSNKIGLGFRTASRSMALVC